MFNTLHLGFIFLLKSEKTVEMLFIPVNVKLIFKWYK